MKNFPVLTFVATASLFLIAPIAKADFMNGEGLLDICQEPIERDCFPYLAGAYDALTTSQYTIITSLMIFHQLKDNMTEAQRALSSTDSFACPPNSLTGNDLRRIVLNWLSRNPDTLEIGGGIIVQAALAEAYPCHY